VGSSLAREVHLKMIPSARTMTEGIRTDHREAEARTGIHFARIKETKTVMTAVLSNEAHGVLIPIEMAKKDLIAAQEGTTKEEIAVEEVKISALETNVMTVVVEDSATIKVMTVVVEDSVSTKVKTVVLERNASTKVKIAMVEDSAITKAMTAEVEGFVIINVTTEVMIAEKNDRINAEKTKNTAVQEKVDLTETPAATIAVDVEGMIRINLATEEIHVGQTTAKVLMKGADRGPVKPMRKIKKCSAIGGVRDQLPKKEKKESTAKK